MLRRYAKNLAVAGGAIGVLGCAWKAELIEDAFLHTPSVQETEIGDMVLKAYEQEVDIVCVPQDALRARMWPMASSMDKTYGIAARWLSKIWLDAEVCDNLEKFAERPIEEKQELTAGEQLAIRTLAHESRHIAGTDNEGQADCEAVQTADKLIRVLGASEGDSRLINAWIAYSVTAYEDSRPEDYSLADCHKEGPWELEPGGDAIFPKPVIEASGK